MNPINIEDYELLYQKHGVQPSYHGGATGNRKSGLSTCPDFAWKCGNKDTIQANELEKLIKTLESYGFELIDDTKSRLIEKIKNVVVQSVHHNNELLVYDELTLSEIAYQMGYSNVAYLSNQFKKVTGLTPSHFKQVKENKRKPLDEV